MREERARVEIMSERYMLKKLWRRIHHLHSKSDDELQRIRPTRDEETLYTSPWREQPPPRRAGSRLACMATSEDHTIAGTNLLQH